VATKLVILDDLDGTEGAQTVRFAVADQTWEIDLSEQNLTNLQKALEPYTSAARVVRHEAGAVQTGTRRRRRSSGTSEDVEPREVRAWANANSIKVNERGRIPAELVQQYKEATGA
jgi:hypothetical protein